MRASPSLLSNTEIFSSWRQRGGILSLLCLLFFLSLLFEYRAYKKLTRFDDYISTAWVVNQYKKKNAWVLKLQSTEGFSFYTTSREDLIDLRGYQVEVRWFTKELDFINYLRGFYAPSVLLSRASLKQERYRIMDSLDEIHSGKPLAIFKALFFAAPIDKSLREQLSVLGVNHLLAISGFHLGVLSFILFTLFKSMYRPAQNRFFPYRNSFRDISVLVLMILFAYLYFLDFVPSLLRAFSMSLFAYFLYDRGIKILSFASVFWVVAFLITLWPKLLFSLGFWLSVAGVFYIFLFLYHMKALKPWQSFILLHLWVYLAMLPIVHVYFGTFSLHQLYSPLLTMLFIAFYPLVLFLHLVGQGDSLDFLLNILLSIQAKSIEVFFPLWGLFFYLILSILAVFNKLFFYFLFLFTFGFLGYLLNRIAEF